MEHSSDFHRTLEKIMSEQTYDQLESFKDPKIWSAMSDKEKELLANLFLKRGIRELKKGDSRVFDHFELSNQLMPRNPKVLFQQAHAFAQEEHHVHCLSHAHKTLEKIAAFGPHFDALFLWGSVLNKLGTFYTDTTYFNEANDKFVKAKQLLTDNKAQVGEFYWKWGHSWHQLARISGEAVDLHQAINYFKQAAEVGYQSIGFNSDFGMALFDLGILVNRIDLVYESTLFFQKVIAEDFVNYNAWLSLADAQHVIAQSTGREEDFITANVSFEQASKLQVGTVALWLKWGTNYLNYGKRRNDTELLEISIDKFKKANALEINHMSVLTRWSEALMLLGAYNERIDLLREAEAKAKLCSEIYGESADNWAIYGFCLNEIGCYFGEEEFYYQAIEKFQQGLALNNLNPSLWYGLALSYFALGETQEEPEMIEKSLQYCSRVNEFHEKTNAQFWNDWAVAQMRLAEMTHDNQHVYSALEKFEQAIQLLQDGQEQEHVQIECYYNYGCALDFLGDSEESATLYEQAIQVLTKVLQLDSNHYHAKFNMGLSYYHLGELISDVECLQKSVEYFQEVLQQNPEDEAAWNELGVTLILLGQLMEDPSNPDLPRKIYEKAENRLLHAASLGNTDAFYNLACLYSLCKNYEAAMVYIEKAERQGELPSLDEILSDEWLDSLRETPEFKHFIHDLSNKNRDEE